MSTIQIICGTVLLFICSVLGLFLGVAIYREQPEAVWSVLLGLGLVILVLGTVGVFG